MTKRYYREFALRLLCCCEYSKGLVVARLRSIIYAIIMVPRKGQYMLVTTPVSG